MSMDAMKAQIIKKAWEDPQFKQQLQDDPASALKEAFGLELPPDIKLNVVEETPSSYYLVIPSKPEDALTVSSKSVQSAWI